MPKKKTNPRRVPATAADVKAAYELGKRETIEFCVAASVLSIGDVFNPTMEQMEAYHEKYTANVAAVLDGQIKYSDVLAALKDEYDIELEFT